MFLTKISIIFISLHFLEVVRTRLREESAQKRSWFSTIGAIYQDGGFRGYYRGLSVQVKIYIKFGQKSKFSATSFRA